MLQYNRMRGQRYVRPFINAKFMRTKIRNNALPSQGTAAVLPNGPGIAVTADRPQTRGRPGSTAFFSTDPQSAADVRDYRSDSAYAYLSGRAASSPPVLPGREGRALSSQAGPQAAPPGTVAGQGDDTGSPEHRAASSVPDYGPVAEEQSVDLPASAVDLTEAVAHSKPEGQGLGQGFDRAADQAAHVHLKPEEPAAEGRATDQWDPAHTGRPQLYHDEDLTAPYLAGQGQGQAGQGQAGQGPSLGRQPGRGHATSARASRGPQSIDPRMTLADSSSPDPNLVMSRDPRYHNSFPLISAGEWESPGGLIPLEPIARAGRAVARGLDHGANLAVALSRGVLDMGRSAVGTARAPGAPPTLASIRAQAAAGTGLAQWTVVPGDPNSVNSPVTSAQMADHSHATWLAHARDAREKAARLGQMVKGQQASQAPHPESSADVRTPQQALMDRTADQDFANEAGGSAYVGAPAGGGAGAGAGVGAPDVPTRPEPGTPSTVQGGGRYYSTQPRAQTSGADQPSSRWPAYGPGQGMTGVGGGLADVPASAASMDPATRGYLYEGPDAATGWARYVRPTTWKGTLAMAHASPPSGRGLVGEIPGYTEPLLGLRKPLGRSYSTSAALRGRHPTTSTSSVASPFEYPQPRGPWAPFAMDGGRSTTTAAGGSGPGKDGGVSKDREDAPYAYAGPDQEEPWTQGTLTVTMSASGQPEVVTAWDKGGAIDQETEFGLVRPFRRVMDWRVHLHPESIAGTTGEAVGWKSHDKPGYLRPEAPSASGAWPRWAEAPQQGWHGTKEGDAADVATARSEAEAGAPLTAMYSDIDGAQPSTAAAPAPGPGDASHTDEPSKAGTAGFVPGPALETQLAPEVTYAYPQAQARAKAAARAVGAPHTGDWATDADDIPASAAHIPGRGSSPYPPSYYDPHSFSPADAQAQARGVDKDAEVAGQGIVGRDVVSTDHVDLGSGKDRGSPTTEHVGVARPPGGYPGLHGTGQPSQGRLYHNNAWGGGAAEADEPTIAVLAQATGHGELLQPYYYGLGGAMAQTKGNANGYQELSPTTASLLMEAQEQPFSYLGSSRASGGHHPQDKAQDVDEAELYGGDRKPYTGPYYGPKQAFGYDAPLVEAGPDEQPVGTSTIKLRQAEEEGWTAAERARRAFEHSLAGRAASATGGTFRDFPRPTRTVVQQEKEAGMSDNALPGRLEPDHLKPSLRGQSLPGQGEASVPPRARTAPADIEDVEDPPRATRQARAQARVPDLEEPTPEEVGAAGVKSMDSSDHVHSHMRAFGLDHTLDARDVEVVDMAAAAVIPVPESIDPDHPEHVVPVDLRGADADPDWPATHADTEWAKAWREGQYGAASQAKPPTTAEPNKAKTHPGYVASVMSQALHRSGQNEVAPSSHPTTKGNTYPGYAAAVADEARRVMASPHLAAAVSSAQAAVTASTAKDLRDLEHPISVRAVHNSSMPMPGLPYDPGARVGDRYSDSQPSPDPWAAAVVEEAQEAARNSLAYEGMELRAVASTAESIEARHYDRDLEEVDRLPTVPEAKELEDIEDEELPASWYPTLTSDAQYMPVRPLSHPQGEPAHVGSLGHGHDTVSSLQDRDPMDEAEWEAAWEHRASEQSRNDWDKSATHITTRVPGMAAYPSKSRGRPGSVFDYGGPGTTGPQGSRGIHTVVMDIENPSVPARGIRVYAPGYWQHPTMPTDEPPSVASVVKPGAKEGKPEAWATGMGVGPGATTVEATTVGPDAGGSPARMPRDAVPDPHHPSPGLNRRYSRVATAGAGPGGLMTAALGLPAVSPYSLMVGATRGMATARGRKPSGELHEPSPLPYVNAAVPPSRVRWALPGVPVDIPAQDEEATEEDVRAAMAAARVESGQSTMPTGFVPDNAASEKVEQLAQQMFKTVEAPTNRKKSKSPSRQKRTLFVLAGPGGSARDLAPPLHDETTAGQPLRPAEPGHEAVPPTRLRWAPPGVPPAVDSDASPADVATAMEAGRVERGRGYIFPSDMHLTPEQEREADQEIARVHQASLGGSDPNYSAPEWEVSEEGMGPGDEVENAVPWEEQRPREGQGGMGVRRYGTRAVGQVPEDMTGPGPAITHHHLAQQEQHMGHPTLFPSGQVRTMCVMCHPGQRRYGGGWVTQEQLQGKGPSTKAGTAAAAAVAESEPLLPPEAPMPEFTGQEAQLPQVFNHDLAAQEEPQHAGSAASNNGNTFQPAFGNVEQDEVEEAGVLGRYSQPKGQGATRSSGPKPVIFPPYTTLASQPEVVAYQYENVVGEYGEEPAVIAGQPQRQGQDRTVSQVASEAFQYPTPKPGADPGQGRSREVQAARDTMGAQATEALARRDKWSRSPLAGSSPYQSSPTEDHQPLVPPSWATNVTANGTGLSPQVTAASASAMPASAATVDEVQADTGEPSTSARPIFGHSMFSRYGRGVHRSMSTSSSSSTATPGRDLYSSTYTVQAEDTLVGDATREQASAIHRQAQGQYDDVFGTTVARSRPMPQPVHHSLGNLLADEATDLFAQEQHSGSITGPSSVADMTPGQEGADIIPATRLGMAMAEQAADQDTSSLAEAGVMTHGAGMPISSSSSSLASDHGRAALNLGAIPGEDEVVEDVAGEGKVVDFGPLPTMPYVPTSEELGRQAAVPVAKPTAASNEGATAFVTAAGVDEGGHAFVDYGPLPQGLSQARAAGDLGPRLQGQGQAQGSAAGVAPTQVPDDPWAGAGEGQHNQAFPLRTKTTTVSAHDHSPSGRLSSHTSGASPRSREWVRDDSSHIHHDRQAEDSWRAQPEFTGQAGQADQGAHHSYSGRHEEDWPLHQQAAMHDKAQRNGQGWTAMDPISGLQVAATTAANVVGSMVPNLAPGSAPGLGSAIAGMAGQAVQGAAALGGAAVATGLGIAASAASAAGQTLASGLSGLASAAQPQQQPSSSGRYEQGQVRDEDVAPDDEARPQDASAPTAMYGARYPGRPTAGRLFQDVEPRHVYPLQDQHEQGHHDHDSRRHARVPSRKHVTEARLGHVNVPPPDSE